MGKFFRIFLMALVRKEIEFKMVWAFEQGFRAGRQYGEVEGFRDHLVWMAKHGYEWNEESTGNFGSFEEEADVVMLQVREKLGVEDGDGPDSLKIRLPWEAGHAVAYPKKEKC